MKRKESIKNNNDTFKYHHVFDNKPIFDKQILYLSKI